MIHSTGSGRTEPVTTQVTPNIGTEAKWSRRHLLDVDDLSLSGDVTNRFEQGLAPY